MSDRDYYEILGLTPDADGAMVDQAYWHLARKYQSLAATNPRASQMLDELNEAYGVVGSPKLREQYDAFRDDVLISKGMIRPVKSSPKRKVEPPSAVTSEPRRLPTLPFRLPSLRREQLGKGGAAIAIVAAAAAGAAYGISPAIVIGAAAAALGVVLMPLMWHRLPGVHLPAIAMPEIRTPRLVTPRPQGATAARPREIVLASPKDEALDADGLHASTAAMISRWRSSIGLRPLAAEGDPATAPSTTLVDIVESERGLDDQDEPLAAVIDILRGARRSPEYR
jgi:hypothetical protein